MDGSTGSEGERGVRLQEWEWLAPCLGAAGAAVGILISSYARRNRLEVAEWTVRLPNLPRAFWGKRIVWFSDVHLGRFYREKDLRELVRTVNGQRADILGFGGDLIDKRESLVMLGRAVPLLREMKAELGKVAILGNHDYNGSAKRVSAALQEGGFDVLVNRTAVFSIGASRLYLAGLDDCLLGRPRLGRLRESAPEDAAAILLVHEPDPAPGRGEHAFPLQLSGHSHGGQVRLPGLKPIVTTKYGKIYPAGLYRTERGLIYTSRGVGTTFLPFRWFCRAEVAVLTLEPAAP